MSLFYKRVVSQSLTPAHFRNGKLIEISKSIAEVLPPAPVDSVPTSTVEAEPNSTVEPESTSTVEAGPVPVLWRAENGAVFPPSRVHHVEQAQDALTRIEESVYDFLWGPKTADPYRLTAAGYAQISKATRIARRSIVDVVARLIEKGFISIERHADILTRQPTQYRILGYRTALDELDRRGRRWVVKSGNGVLFVRRLEPRQTIEAGSTSTVEAVSTSTVELASTVLISRVQKNNESSSSALVQAFTELGVTFDDDAAVRLRDRCRVHDSKATFEEITHFTEVKLIQLRRKDNVRNLVGLLLKAVPEYFRSPATELNRYRADRTDNSADNSDLQMARQSRWAAEEVRRMSEEGPKNADKG